MQVRITRNHLRMTLLSAALFTATAAAQSDDSLNDRLLACDALQNGQDRLACFNSVVEGLDRPAAPAAMPETEATTPAEAAADIDIEPAPEPAPVVEATPAAEPSAVVPDSPQPAPAAGPDAALQPERRPAVAASARPPAPPPQPEPVAEESGDRRDLTGEAVIVRVWENYDGRFTVELDNGQVWRETQGTRVGIPDVGADVEITRSLFGAYRMKIDGIPQVAWIRPTD